MAGKRTVTFTPQAAARIARVVRDAERGGKDQLPIWFRRGGDGDGGGGDGEQIRLGTIDATWTKGTIATVGQLNADGTEMDPPVNFTAQNWFATITVTSGSKKVACGKVGNSWILLSADCA